MRIHLCAPLAPSAAVDGSRVRSRKSLGAESRITLRHAPDTNSQLKGAIDWQKVDSTWHETRSLASAEDVWPGYADRRPHGSPRAALGSWGDIVHQHARQVDCRSPISWGAAMNLVDCPGGLLVDCVFEPSSDGASTCANVRMKPQCHVCEDTRTT